MVIEFPTQTDEVTQAMHDGMNQIFRPLKVYILGLPAIQEMKPPTDDDYAGWHFLALLAPNTGLSHHVSQKPGEVPLFAGVSFGRQAAGVLLAAQQITNLPGVPEGAYQARMLSVPGLLTEAFWLKATSTGSDLAVAYDSNAPGLKLMYPYPLGMFLEILQPLAGKRLKFATALADPPVAPDPKR